ncbi:MAG: Ig-like domain repeat protein, partial [Candidatus Sulfotelmatobacter sp.]
VSSVTTGDLNGDGKPDIVIGNLCEPIVGGLTGYDVNCANGAIGVLLGNGDGTFQYGPSYDIPDANFYSIALADVNGDGKLDYVGSTGTGVAVSFGNGDGSFQPPTVYAALSVGWDVQLAIADLNGDGGLDIVQPSDNGQLAILYNQGFSNPQPVVTLQSSMDPSTYGQQVTFTATVTPTSGTPTGTVTFMDGATKLAIPVTLANGSASLTFGALAAGTHSIVADYSGDNNFLPANSAALTQKVNQASTAIQVASSANPSYVDQGVTFRATVTGQFQGPATGSVTFKQGKVILGTETLTNGQAIYATTFTTTGARSITATYSGDGNDLASTSSTLKQVVDSLPAATTTSVATSGSPLFVGQSASFTAKEFSTYGPIPDGETVTFSDGSTTLATVALSGGIAVYSTSSLKAATHTIKVAYAGDGTFKASTGSVKEVINLYPSATSAPGSGLNPSTYGQAVTLTVTVSSTAPNTPSGTVTFKNGAATLGTATLNSGVATLTKTNLPVGSLSISAVYSGDSETAKGTSAVMIQTVNQATTATAVTSSRNPSNLGQLVKFTATVTSSTTTPTGTVTFMDGSNVLTTANLAGGKASYSTSALGAGSHNITAGYNGTANITGSTSTVLVQTVN